MDQIKPVEYVIRYIFHKNHFSVTQKRPKYAVFMPSPHGETSVFCISDLSDNEIWNIGDCEVSQKRGLPLLGRADISAFHILKQNLKLIQDNIPPRHANIVGWPSEKSGQKLIAMELAENAQLYLKQGNNLAF